MVDVANTIYYKTKAEANVLVSLTPMHNLNYGEGIILIISTGQRIDCSIVIIMNCKFSQNSANQIVSNTFKFNSSNKQQVDNDSVDFL